MKIQEAVECMSKSYLHRVLDSYTKDTTKKPDEEGSRRRLISDIELLSATDNIKQRLNLKKISFDSQILSQFILEILLECDDYRADEDFILDEVKRIESAIVSDASSPDVFKFKQTESINTYKTVLVVALKDSRISDDEKNLLTRLREHLGLSQRDHYLIQSSLNKFPKEDNQLHNDKEIKAELVELQRRGVVFYCNQCSDGGGYVIPSEIASGVKTVLGVQLGDKAYQLLLAKLSRDGLKVILEFHNLPISGKKEEQIQRIFRADISPSDALNSLNIEDLYSLCKSLPGVNVSGAKAVRIANVIDHFDKLRTPSSSEDTNLRERYYDYFIELAKRDRQNLLSNNIIKKDLDMEAAFEEATRYIFEEKFGLSLEQMAGLNHPDGTVRFPDNNELLMWDNKSKEKSYDFPNDHFRQFRGYIHDSTERVRCFLVIAPEPSEKSLVNAYKLKGSSGHDTDVALISAENLKWIAENWQSCSPKSKVFNLEVLNYTGILDSQTIKQRLKALMP